MKQIDSLYILKAICAALVVFIHVPTIPLLAPVTRIGVPCFLMMSGYFLMDSRGMLDVGRVKHALHKNAKITLQAIAFYLLVTILTDVWPDGKAESYWLDLRHWARVLFYGDSIMCGNYEIEILWYMVAYIETLLVILLLARKQILSCLAWLLPLGLTANIIFGRYSFLVGGPYDEIFATNFFTFGIPFVSVGMCLKIKRVQRWINSIPLHWIVWLTLLSILLSAIEYYFQAMVLHLRNMGDLNIFTIPAAIGTMIIALRHTEVPGYLNWLKFIGKNCSLHIYLFHILVVLVFLYVLPKTYTTNIYNAFTILAVTTLCSCLYILLSKQKNSSTAN